MIFDIREFAVHNSGCERLAGGSGPWLRSSTARPLSTKPAKAGDLFRRRSLIAGLYPDRAAGAKYAAAGLKFEPGYDEWQPVIIDLAIFENAGIKVRAA